MATDSTDVPASGPDLAAPAEGVIHNSVLIRSHEPVRTTHSWVAPTLLGVAILAGAIIWGVMSIQPTTTVVNHSVAAAPTAATAYDGKS